MTEHALTRFTILVVDDDRVFRDRLVLALRDRGLRVVEAGDGVEAAAVAREVRPGRAVVDLRMPGESGLDVVKNLLEIDPDMAVVVLTGYGSIVTAKDALRMGAIDYLTKPADADQILAAFGGNGVHAAAEPVEVPSLARIEWEHIQRVLNDCEGNVSQAARMLGIHRRSLQRKLSKFAPPESAK